MKKLLVSLLLLLSFMAYSQQTKEYVPQPKYPELFKTIPPINNDAPHWVKLMYSKNVNFHQLKQAFQEYYKDKVFIKNTHTQNYKYFIRQVQNNQYLQKDGSIYIPITKQEQDKKTQQLLKERGLSNASSHFRGTNSSIWTPIGPFETCSGQNLVSSQANVYNFEQSTSNPDVLYASTETGGLFKSTDKGLHWFPIGDFFFTSGNVSAIAIDPTNENIVFVSRGRKLYKTTNGGNTWQEILDEYRLYINAIAISSINPQIIIIAGEQHIKRSVNGGQTWTNIFNDTGWDIKFKTDEPNTVFLLKYNPILNICGFYKSTDAGQTFTLKDNGWFNPPNGGSDAGARMTVTNADSNRIYAVLLGSTNDGIDDNGYIGIYRSDDAGESWIMPYDGNNDGTPDNIAGGPYSSTHWCLTGFNPTQTNYHQGFYNLDIEASDTDPDKFLVGFLNLYKSDNAGESYIEWGGYRCNNCGSGYRHPDIQDIDINGNDVWVSSDGGIDYYDADFAYVSSKKNGINGSEFWGLGQGWNEDVLVGGRYHNGNTAYYQTYTLGDFISLGGGEAATGYVNQGENRKTYYSDFYSGCELPITVSGDIRNIPNYTMFPTESYVLDKKSEVVTHPAYWNTIYLGKENKLWKSTDGGINFNLVHAFGNNNTDYVMSIEVSRTDPNLIYLTQKYHTKIWKSTDGGNTWTEINLPRSRNVMYISLNTNNELFLALTYGGTDPYKIYKSVNGGASWINLTTARLNGVRLQDVCTQLGTDGGVYVGSGRSFWYRNNTMSDWHYFSEGLPLIYHTITIMKPFYKKSKMRTAGNRGIWEIDFFEPSMPIAQPMVKNKNIDCYMDEIQFEDHSILNHSGATWQWSFPGASYISSTTVRNPIVKYPSYGSYDVSLTITDAQGHSDTKTIANFIEVGNNCDASILDSDNDTLSDSFENNVCTTNISSSNNLNSGENVIISNFEGNTSGVFNTKLNFLTTCTNETAQMRAYVDLDNQTILVTAYTHFGSTNTTDAVLNNNTSEVTSLSNAFSKIAVQLVNNNQTGEKNLILKVISNACNGTTKLGTSCMANIDYDGDGIPNYLDTDSDDDGISDTIETQVCNNIILSTPYFGSGVPETVVDFGNSTDGIYFVTINAETRCYHVTSLLKARINLQQQTITVIEYDHFGSDFNDNILGSGTNELVSTSSAFAKLKYKLEYNQTTSHYELIVEQVSNACGSFSRIDSGSCWSNLDTDNNGHIDYLDNPALSVDENSTFSKIIPYPNPTKQQTVGFKNLDTSYKFTLFDTSGKQLIYKTYKRGEKVDLKHLSSGTYFYQIETDNRIQNGKIIID
jgi:photosystem II stability/assembly factor-like uncharacterized protein